MKKIIFSFISLSCITNYAMADSKSYNVPAHASLTTGSYIEEIDSLSFGTVGFDNNTDFTGDDEILSIDAQGGNLNNPRNAQVSGYHRGKIRMYAPSGTIIGTIGFSGNYEDGTVRTTSADGKSYFMINPSFPGSEGMIVPETGYVDILYGGRLAKSELLKDNKWSSVPKNQTHSATFNINVNY